MSRSCDDATHGMVRTEVRATGADGHGWGIVAEDWSAGSCRVLPRWRRFGIASGSCRATRWTNDDDPAPVKLDQIETQR